MRSSKVPDECCSVTRNSRSRKAAEKQPRWKMFPLYLRALDAEAAGILRTAAAKLLFPEQTDVYPEYCGSKHVRNALNAAKRWQRDYLFVACAR